MSVTALATLFAVWWGLTRMAVRRIEIPIRGLPKEMDGFTLAHLSDLHLDLVHGAAWLQSVVEKTNRLNPDLIAITGDLAEMGLVDLLQVLAASGKTARVRIHGPGGEPGEMSLEGGRLVDARQKDLVGLDAFNAILVRMTGRFTVETRPPENRTIDAPIESLLLEACRLLDEASMGESGSSIL